MGHRLRKRDVAEQDVRTIHVIDQHIVGLPMIPEETYAAIVNGGVQ